MDFNIDELKKMAKYIVGNNKDLQEKGKKPTAMEIIGDAGLGKTSMVMQVADELKMDCVKLNITQLDEIGDLIGFPFKQYNISKGGETKTVSEDLLNVFLNNDWQVVSSVPKMSYAKPTWLPSIDNPNGGILLIDDWNRGENRFLQALMELIDRGQYISWSLPKFWSIILTSNPDNGDYNVNSLDVAQRTRYISFNLKYDPKVWARWAEGEGLDNRGINFILFYPEILKGTGETQIANPRSVVTFLNTISGIPDWESDNSIIDIVNISKGCFDDKDNIVGNYFAMFIKNKLDKLLHPEEMISMEWKQLKNRLETLLYGGDIFRTDIASVLSTRFLNYVLHSVKKKEIKFDVVSDRLLEIIHNDKVIFTEDALFYIVRTLNSEFSSKMGKILADPEARKMLLS